MSMISIHAPRTGSDQNAIPSVTGEEDFNPRSPHGERPARAAIWPPTSTNFNPRSPHGERHPVGVGTFFAEHISIHAPRTGSDFNIRKFIKPCKISIHAPRTGSDQKALKTGADPVIFQSTLPARGATLHQFAMICPCLSFQSTLPARGATRISAEAYTRLKLISIHAPRTGSDYILQDIVDVSQISIHAPRTGSDGKTYGALKYVIISIHAPRTGSDRHY